MMRTLEATASSHEYVGIHAFPLRTLEEGFVLFLKEKGNQPKEEYFITVVINDLVERGLARFRVFASRDSWFGITYPETRPGGRKHSRPRRAGGIIPRSCGDWGGNRSERFFNAEAPMTETIVEIARQFSMEAPPQRVEPFGSGHIHDTYRVTCEDASGSRAYILQRINRNVFRNPEAVMDNIHRVTRHLQRKIETRDALPENRRETLSLIPARNGAAFHRDSEGEYWRVYEFIDRRKPSIRPARPNRFSKRPGCSGNSCATCRTFRPIRFRKPSRIFTTRPCAIEHSSERWKRTRPIGARRQKRKFNMRWIVAILRTGSKAWLVKDGFLSESLITTPRSTTSSWYSETGGGLMRDRSGHGHARAGPLRFRR